MYRYLNEELFIYKKENTDVSNYITCLEKGY